MYARGKGVAQNPVEAHAWLELAAMNGTEPARKHLAKLESEMSLLERIEATRRARQLFDQLKRR